MIVNDEDYEFLQSTLGLSVSKHFKTNGVSYIPEAHVAWLHEFEDEEQANTSTFTGGGGSFATRGLNPADDGLNAGASMAIASDTIELRAAYDYEVRAFDDNDYDSHTVQLVFRYNF